MHGAGVLVLVPDCCAGAGLHRGRLRDGAAWLGYQGESTNYLRLSTPAVPLVTAPPSDASAGSTTDWPGGVLLLASPPRRRTISSSRLSRRTLVSTRLY
jgi:hypothetical protein